MIIIFSLIFIVRGRKKSIFPSYKLNLSKKFLTFCYSRLKDEQVNEGEIIREFLNLLQKIFEARLVTYFSFIGSEIELKYHSEPFFPYTYGINSMIDFLSKGGVKSVLTNEQIYLIEIDQNKHRLSMPISISTLVSNEIKRLSKAINSDTIVIIPIYRLSEIEGLYFVFTRSSYFSKENAAIVNLLIDHVSLILVLSSTKDSLNRLLTTLKLGFKDIHSDLDENIKTILTNTLADIAKLVDIPVLIVDRTTSNIILANDRYLDYFGNKPIGRNINEVISSYRSISDNIIFSGSRMFEMKKISLPNIDSYGIIFYQSQIIDQRVITETYGELLEIRKYFAFVNKISVVPKSLDFFVKYQQNDKVSETGGDIFVLLDHEKRSFVAIFDVSGHNIASGFVAITIKNFVERVLSETRDIIIAANELNNFLLSINDEWSIPTYATGIICEIDKERGKLKYICGGHKYGIILKEDSIVDISKISTISKPFGISRDVKFIMNNFEVSIGDKVFLYTDGIVEIEDEKGFIIDNSKVIDLIIFCKNLSVRDTINEIFSYIKSLKSVRIVDDFLILGIEIKG